MSKQRIRHLNAVLDAIKEERRQLHEQLEQLLRENNTEYTDDHNAYICSAEYQEYVDNTKVKLAEISAFIRERGDTRIVSTVMFGDLPD